MNYSHHVRIITHPRAECHCHSLDANGRESCATAQCNKEPSVVTHVKPHLDLEVSILKERGVDAVCACHFATRHCTFAWRTLTILNDDTQKCYPLSIMRKEKKSHAEHARLFEPTSAYAALSFFVSLPSVM